MYAQKLVFWDLLPLYAIFVPTCTGKCICIRILALKSQTPPPLIAYILCRVAPYVKLNMKSVRVRSFNLILNCFGKFLFIQNLDSNKSDCMFFLIEIVHTLSCGTLWGHRLRTWGGQHSNTFMRYIGLLNG